MVWSLTQPPLTPEASLVDCVVVTKHGCLSRDDDDGPLVTPELSSRLTQFYLVLAWPVLRRQVVSTGHQPRSLSALSVFPAHTHTADNTRDSRYSALALAPLASSAKLKISNIQNIIQ